MRSYWLPSFRFEVCKCCFTQSSFWQVILLASNSQGFLSLLEKLNHTPKDFFPCY